MTCRELEILLAEYVDGTLPEEQRTAVESHLPDCANCAELARDAAGAVAFMERAAAIEPPPELVTRILSATTNQPGRSVGKSSWMRRWSGTRPFKKWLEPVFQPRFAMGMAMTVLSFAMVGQLPGVQIRQWNSSSLNPAHVWMAAENRMERTWERAVKNYESTRLVFEIQAQLQEWADDQPAGGVPTERNPADGNNDGVESR